MPGLRGANVAKREAIIMITWGTRFEGFRLNKRMLSHPVQARWLDRAPKVMD